jgi:hypothetical protein
MHTYIHSLLFSEGMVAGSKSRKVWCDIKVRTNFLSEKCSIEKRNVDEGTNIYVNIIVEL